MIILSGFVLLALLLLSPQSMASAARLALSVWGLDVVPSLFPYMVLCRLLSARLAALRLPAPVAILTLGLLGGSPSGSAVVASYAAEKRLSRRTLLAFSALTGTLSPMFLLGTVSRWFASNVFGRLLLLSHVSGALMTCVVVFLFFHDDDQKRTESIIQTPPFPLSPISASVQAVLNVGGCIVFFSVLAESLHLLFPALSADLQAIAHGALEISGGLHALSRSGFPLPACALLSAALCGFGSLSLLMQNDLFLSPCGVRLPQLFSFSLLRAFFSALCMFLFLTIP